MQRIVGAIRQVPDWDCGYFPGLSSGDMVCFDFTMLDMGSSRNWGCPKTTTLMGTWQSNPGILSCLGIRWTAWNPSILGRNHVNIGPAAWEPIKPPLLKKMEYNPKMGIKKRETSSIHPWIYFKNHFQTHIKNSYIYIYIIYNFMIPVFSIDC